MNKNDGAPTEAVKDSGSLPIKRRKKKTVAELEQRAEKKQANYSKLVSLADNQLGYMSGFEMILWCVTANV